MGSQNGGSIMQLSRVEIITGISKIEPLKKALGKFRIT